jgi:serine/threonine protein kinase
LADVYSLSIIIYELFSGIDPFPGNIFQIFRAILSDKKPDMPTKFPSNLKELICRGWSKEPKERPKIKEIKDSLMTMLNTKETVSYLSQALPEIKKQEAREPTLASASGWSSSRGSKINVILGKIC